MFVSLKVTGILGLPIYKQGKSFQFFRQTHCFNDDIKKEKRPISQFSFFDFLFLMFVGF